MEVLEFFVRSDQPFSLVEEESFQKMVKILKILNKQKIPERTTIKSDVMEIYNAVKAKLKAILNVCDN